MKTRFTAPLQARRGDPRGQVLVLFALMLVVLLLVSALAVDYGGWLVAKRNYQNVGDAAALAGAQQLSRPLSAGKNVLARQAAWESVKSALDLPALIPATQALSSSGANSPYVANGFTVWVASPPADAGNAYLGHVSGPGNVYVRIEHPGQTFLSNIAGMTRTVTAWSTAGRFPANFAVIGMCSPTSVTANCLAGDSNIKLDGTNTNLIVGTGDLGTNRWTKSGGGSSGVALGPDSNAYMQLFDTCWASSTNQCQLWGYNSPNIDYTTIRSAIPLGAPIPDPSYVAPATGTTATPNQCRGTLSAAVASIQVLERNDPVADLPIALAAAVKPIPPGTITDGAVKVSGIVSSGGVSVYAGVTVDLMNGAAVVNTTTTDGAGAYNFNGVANSPPNYTLRVTDSTLVQKYATTTTISYTFSSNTTVDISVSKNPFVTGTVRNANTSAAVSGATVTITALGVDYTATTNASGVYSKYVPAYGSLVSFALVASATGYSNGSALVPVPTAVDQTYTVNFSLTPAPATLTGTITDAVPNPTNLPVPGITVTLGTGQSTTTDASGNYTFASATVGTTTISLSGTSMIGYAYSTPASGSTITISSGANTRNFTVWPKGCYDGISNASKGSWSCDWPLSGNCPAATNVNAANVNCVFTQANAIRPGSYTNITLPSGTCAWFDPKGGVTGLAAGQSPGVYHIRGTLDIGNGSYLFGDGVTLIFDQNANINVGNSGGFVLNFGTHKVSATPGVCDVNTDFTTPYLYGDTGEKCFRTVGASGTQDYAYGAWTTKSHVPWTSGTFPTYNDSVVQKGQELGITFFMWCPPASTCGLGNSSRMKLATANMGYLFNGVLYAPNDDIQLGGGKDGQSAAGQLVGWTIEYHGGTRILQNWYGDPVDGQPFLIEPVLGE